MNLITITPEPIHDYCKKHSSNPSAELQNLIPATQDFAPHVSHMQVGHLEGNLLSILVKLMGATRILEFGTFTGYSALAMAESLPDHGVVFTLDRDPKATAVAVDHWNQSPHGSKIKLMLGDAKETCKTLNESFDMAFIDADKSGYDFYYETSLKLVKTGGAIIVDNVLWSGAVLNPQNQSDRIIHSFNEKVAKDPRVLKVMLPVRDGITIMVKL